MTISNTTNRTDLAAGNGVTVNFTFSFKILAAANLKVWTIDSDDVATLKTLSTHYTVAINTQTEGGTVTFLAAPASGLNVLIKRVLTYDQATDFPTESNFPEESVEDTVDYLTMLAIQLNEESDRTIKLAETSTVTDVVLADPVENKMLVVDADGNIAMSESDFTDIEVDLAAVAAIAADVTAVAAIDADVTTVAGISANVTTVAGMQTNIASVVANLADIQNAASFGFPTLTSADIGKLLQINSTNDGYIVAEGLGRKNAIINGDFNIWQRGTSFAAIADGAYAADRFQYGKVLGAGVHTVSRSTDVPTVAEAGRLFNYSLLVDCTTLEAAIAAGEYAFIRTKIEGYNFLPLAQKAFTVSFWVKATKTGTYCAAFRNSVSDRSYVAEYSVLIADTWEKKTVNVSASPSAGTWDFTTGIGLDVTFTLAGGSTFQTTADAWQTGDYFSTSSQVNAVDSASNNFRIVGVQLESGSVATPFEQRNFQQELNLCQRYYEKSYNVDVAPGTATNEGAAWLAVGDATAAVLSLSTRFKVEKRAASTTTAYDSAGASGKCFRAANGKTADIDMIGTSGFRLYTNDVTSSSELGYQWTANAEI